MKKRFIISISVIVIIIIGGVVFYSMFNKDKGFIPANGVVPDEATAIKLAEAIWFPIYGYSIYTKEPFVAEYDEKTKTWYVCGTLPANTLGGVPEIKINKTDGKVLYINHGK